MLRRISPEGGGEEVHGQLPRERGTRCTVHGRRLGPRSTVRGVGEVTTHQVTLVQLSVVTVSGVVSACVAPCLACNVTSK